MLGDYEVLGRVWSVGFKGRDGGRSVNISVNLQDGDDDGDGDSARRN